MNKINPLQKIAGLPEDRQSDKPKDSKIDSNKISSESVHVEISPKARMVQQADAAQKTNSGVSAEDTYRVGDQWYLNGYLLKEAD